MSYYPKSKTDKWATPQKLYDELHKEFKFDFDPCPIDWKEGDADGLAIPWGKVNFVNPPYSQVKKWVKKAYDEYLAGNTSVLLVNVCTDTMWFHDYVYNQATLRFIKGRIKFVKADDPTKQSPNVRPSMLVIFDPKKN